MEVNTAHGSLYLIEADVVEPFEAGAGDGPHPMVGDKEVLLPSHEDMLALGEVAVCKVGSLRLLCQRSPGRKPRPVVQICLLCRTPGLIASLERVFGPDDLSFEKGGQGRMILREA